MGKRRLERGFRGCELFRPRRGDDADPGMTRQKDSPQGWKCGTEIAILVREGEVQPTRPSPRPPSGQRPPGSSVDPNEVPDHDDR